MIPRYPVYIPSRDRYQKDRALTVKALLRDKVPFRLVVVPSQASEYRPWVSARDQLLVLPGDDYRLLETRNWIRDHAESEGHARHWQLDDNISLFYRLWEGERIPAHAGVSLRVVEDLSDRYENVGISGMNYTMFVPRDCAQPVYKNVHVYSCTLVNHAMPYRWRLVLNDDTDICLQALVNGWSTLLVNAFNAQKAATMYISGGNTDALYRDNAGEDENVRDTQGRYEMARALERMWPGTVTVTRKFRRFQHSVNWAAFQDVQLRLRPDPNALAALAVVDEYGMELRQLKTPKSPKVAQSLTEYARVLAEIVDAPPLWRGLPAFRPTPAPPKLVVQFHSEQERDAMLERRWDGAKVSISKRTNGTPSVWWPPRSRNDYASLRFEPSSDAVRSDLHGTSVDWPGRQPMTPTGSGTPQAQPGRSHQSESVTITKRADGATEFRVPTGPADAVSVPDNDQEDDDDQMGLFG